MANPAQALTEMRRVLKPGGRFIIGEMYRDNQTDTQLTHVYLHHRWAAIDTALGTTHRETYTRQQIRDLVSDLNLRDWAFSDYADLKIRLPLDRRSKSLNDLVCFTYEERAINPSEMKDIEIREPLKSWLTAHQDW